MNRDRGMCAKDGLVEELRLGPIQLLHIPQNGRSEIPPHALINWSGN